MAERDEIPQAVERKPGARSLQLIWIVPIIAALVGGFIGRWSMLDIFVVAVLVALVQIKAVAEIQAGPAALAFGAVVVLTIFAANSFDSRLIWDSIRADYGPDED